MWKPYGLKRSPKIDLVETKQITPDQSLFGQSNFSANGFSVVIQMTPSKSNKINAMLKDDLESPADDAGIKNVPLSNVALSHQARVRITSQSSSRVAQEGESQSESEGDSVAGINTKGANTDSGTHVTGGGGESTAPPKATNDIGVTKTMNSTLEGQWAQ